MSFLTDSLLLDSTVADLLHFPEELELFAALPPSRVTAGRRNLHSSSVARSDGGEDKGTGSVPVDILETPKNYAFFLDVPGLPKSEIQVTLEDTNILAVKGGVKRKREEEEDGCRYLRLERKASPPKFLRKFRLPEDANTSAITAKCEDGVLTVLVEKLPPTPEPKTKTVEVPVA
ncbi:hypothetical protein HPP92_002376 [Vanilla planifolia]|uniref:SHSP domain-containing protein n=1 Tax=Vanilla planifolia TaxID=51239 RepID=A0A835RZU8_VANPL|nr:hypothetical protein HPP92_002376 [Vanilla planifolia]